MIFQTELTTLDSQINQLLAQVEVVRQKQAELTELDALTNLQRSVGVALLVQV